MSSEHLQRFRDRAEAERKRAKSTRDPLAARAALELARKYEAVADAYGRLGVVEGEA